MNVRSVVFELMHYLSDGQLGRTQKQRWVFCVQAASCHSLAIFSPHVHEGLAAGLALLPEGVDGGFREIVKRDQQVTSRRTGEPLP
jgi:hypothetical protein